MPLTIHSRSVAQTEAIGVRLGELLKPGDFIGLSGTLGAGKTALVRGIARGAGVPEESLVSSPTFAIVNAYEGGRLPVFHADLYRVSDAEELYDAGFYDLMESGGAMLVEWIDRVPDVVPSDWLEVRLAHATKGRDLGFFAHGARAESLIAAAATG